MIRFPYTLEIWDTAVNKWRVVGRCNVHYNGRAQFIKSQNGEVIQYTYEVIMPPNIEPIEEKEEVRIIDNRGRNIFDHRHGSQIGSTVEDSVSYPVLGFYKSGQRYESTKIWL